MRKILSIGQRRVIYIKKSRNFFKKNRRISRDDQTNFEYKPKPVYSTSYNSVFGCIFLKSKDLTTQNRCRYFVVQIHRDLNFDEQLNRSLML